MAILTDWQIGELLNDRKVLAAHEVARLKTPCQSSDGDLVESIDVIGDSGASYRVIARRNSNPALPNNFSIILHLRNNAAGLNLIRCNGHHGPHDNKIEKRLKQPNATIPRDQFHIHRATERYQRQKGSTPESYAEPTNEYSSFEQAVEYMMSHFGFEVV